MEILTAAHTRIGGRKVNQDAYCLRVVGSGASQTLFAVLCDGAGGLAHGEVASAMAVRAFDQWFWERREGLLTTLCSSEWIFDQWRGVLTEVNAQIYSYGLREGLRLGTTAVVFLALNGQYYVMNVGDSRCYCLDGGVERITRDHTLAQLAVDQNQLPAEEAMSDPRRRMLLRCVGADEAVLGDCFHGPLSQDALYLMCTDGFYHTLTDAELGELAGQTYRDDGDMRVYLESRFDLIQSRGERDNSTALLFRAGSSLWPAERTVDLRHGIALCRLASSLEDLPG